MSHDVGRGAPIIWRDAWMSANERFYGSQNAEDHFLTSIEMSSTVAAVIARMIDSQRSRLDAEDFHVIDIGAGSGRLLELLRTHLGDDVHLLGVDIRERPADLPADISWHRALIDSESENITQRDGEICGIVIAHEFLDDVPCDVVELDDELEPRVVLVDPASGIEELGPRLEDPAARRLLTDARVQAMMEWLRTWWPPTRPGARREIGLDRERVWSKLTGIVHSGMAIAVDYAHARSDRAAGLWDAGTVKGFSGGRPRRSTPDGTCNVTAHVSIDALASPTGTIASQSQVIADSTLNSWPSGLGSYTWLMQPIERGTMTS